MMSYYILARDELSQLKSQRYGKNLAVVRFVLFFFCNNKNPYKYIDPLRLHKSPYLIGDVDREQEVKFWWERQQTGVL